jgi:hypothetical protein
VGTVTDTFVERLPQHGYATDDYSRGIRVYAVAEAIKRAIIQYNWKHSLSWLVYDLDTPTAAWEWEDKPVPPPNLIALNRDNGHGHLFYGLSSPVHNYDGASQKALRYMGAIDVALTYALGADPGYSKLLSKNPTHSRWLTLVIRGELYDLDELAGWIDLSKYQDKRKRLPAVGLGRNSTLFETLRVWTYRARREPFLSEEVFFEAVRNRALQINASFPTPLTHSEVRSTAKSVARWTWRKMSPDGFRASQSARGKRSGVVRQRTARELRQAIVEAHRQCPGLVQADLAAMFGVSRQTVNSHLQAAKREGVKRTISDNRPSPGPPGGIYTLAISDKGSSPGPSGGGS